MARNDKPEPDAPDAPEPDDEFADDTAELAELRAENDELRAQNERLVGEAAARPAPGAAFTTAARGPSEQAMREQAVMARSEGARLDRIQQANVAAARERGVRLADTPVSAMAEDAGE